MADRRDFLRKLPLLMGAAALMPFRDKSTDGREFDGPLVVNAEHVAVTNCVFHAPGGTGAIFTQKEKAQAAIIDALSPYLS